MPLVNFVSQPELDGRKVETKGWYSRRKLLHYDGGSIYQFVTLRLFDSIPRAILNQFSRELSIRKVENIDRERLILMDKYLDLGSGSCLLAKRPIAQIVVDSLIHLEETSLDLFSWVIMPNHVHMLIKPKNGTELSSLMHSLKSYTAHEANKTLGRKGKFWMREYFDRFIRDHEHFVRTVNYIENNPVKARLCRERNGWEFSSAYGMTDEEIYARLF